MVKEILLKIVKFIGQIIFLCIVVAFLAKTGNMPTMIPKEYVNKIVEYTDKTLFTLGIVKNAKKIKKYAEKNTEVKVKTEKKIEKQENVIEERTAVNAEVLTSKEIYRMNIFEKLYNFLLLNNYESDIIQDLNDIGDTLNISINNQLKKLDNIIDSSYIKSIIKEKELGIQNKESLAMADNIISEFKYIAGFFVYDKEKLLTSINKENKIGIDIKPVIQRLKSSGSPIDIYESGNKTFYLYLISNYQGEKDVLFFLEPEYFNAGINNLNIIQKFIIFNKEYKIINANINDEELINKLEGSISLGSMEYKGDKFNLKYLKLKNINLYAGILFEKYSAVYMLLNVLKILLIAGILYLIFMGVKLLLRKMKTTSLKNKPDELEMVTNAMMEVAKSIKSAAPVPANVTAMIDKKDVEEVVNTALGKYVSQAKEYEQEYEQRMTLSYMPVSNYKKPKKQSKDADGWKLIEP